MGNSSMIVVMMMMVVVAMCASSCSVAVGGMMMSGDQALIDGTTTANTTQTGLDVTFDNVKRAGEGCVVLYEHDSSKASSGIGKNHEFCLDDRTEYRVNDLSTYKMNDMTSAVDVGKGVAVNLYKDANLKGSMIRLSQAGWTDIGDRDGHDTISSLLLQKTS